MGPELIAAVLGPVVGGMISVMVWQAKRNADSINKNINSLHDCVHVVEKKVDGIQLDVAKNYVTNDQLQTHIDTEEEWHAQHHSEVKELRREFNEKTERLSNDVSEMKDMQWKIRIDQLDMKNRKD